MTYLNPVYRGSFPDPFVLKYCGEYWAYCTGVWRDGRWFGVLRSRDLVSWEELGGALEPLPGLWPCQWAPELICAEGRFFLYYSLGDEATMHLRVAVAAHPAGPFVDSGRRLTREPFAIDPHVFTDDDGTRHLFYATDFLEHTHIGTGTVRDRLLDPLTPEGRPAPVTRARYDWHVYDPQRAEKGGVRWHTVEGPFVLKRKGRYAQMFSAGNWQNPSYGVSFASSPQIDAAHEWEQAADGERVLPILRSIPGLVVGPGHNSVVRGPDNMQLFAVYHRWLLDAGVRAMAIDPLEWVGERLVVLGPSTTERPAPNKPAAVDWFDRREAGLGPRWACAGGDWRAAGGAAVQRAGGGLAQAVLGLDGLAFVCEVSLRASGGAAPAGPGGCGVALRDGAGELLSVQVQPGAGRLVIGRPGGELGAWALPPEPPDAAFHLLRLCVDGRRVSVALDLPQPRWRGLLARLPAALALQTAGMAAEFAGFALTCGWEDLFDGDEPDPSALGWEGAGWRVSDGALRCTAAVPEGALVRKGPLPPSYELAVNVGLEPGAPPGARYGFCPALGPDGGGPRVLLEQTGAGWGLRCRTSGALLPLPAQFDPAAFQHFRFRVAAGRVAVAWEAQALGALPAPAAPRQIGLVGQGAGAVFEMVRLVELA
jgi:GH43 family beta-xylosidase